MTKTNIISKDEVRTRFARAMSDMYRAEVPQYGALVEMVTKINSDVLRTDGKSLFSATAQRLDLERHGAIRVGTAAELGKMRRLFAVMGMEPVGYYDLSVAGIPVHSTAFRPIDESSLQRCPFRVFTSLLRLDLIGDPALHQRASEILARRNIFTDRCLELIRQFEGTGGLTEDETREFIDQALETFRWHSQSTVDIETYRSLRAAHPLVADVVCFKGPHINHLTPRVLDIDAAQLSMVASGLRAKSTIEGPPRRLVPILLRQTSFLALEEAVEFPGLAPTAGTHTARFGEIEQRGCALTPAGRQLYDQLLTLARQDATAGDSDTYQDALRRRFQEFPDDLETLRRRQLIYVRYSVNNDAPPLPSAAAATEIERLVDDGFVQCAPMTYEDFLPVSAAGIFRSNIGGSDTEVNVAHNDRPSLEAALGCSIVDEFEVYQRAQADSATLVLQQLAARTGTIA